MKKILLILAKPLLGKGLIDRYIPFVIPVFQKMYAMFQKENVRTVSIPLGMKLRIFAKDLGVGLPLLLKKMYEPTQTGLFLKKLRTGNTVIDIGANVGYYSLLASKKVGKKGKVFAFEPDKQTGKLLLENISLNNCTNIAVISKAVTKNNETLVFYSEPENKGESALSYRKSLQNTYPIEGISLDTFVVKQKIKKIDCIKIDIEGGEVDALLGAAKTITNSKRLSLFIEYNPPSLQRYKKHPEKLISLLVDMGVTIVSIVDESRNKIIPYSKENLKNVLTHTTYCNLYAVK